MERINENDDIDMTVELDLMDGKKVTCAIVTILTVNEKDYIVLLPLDDEGQSTEGEVWFYGYKEDESDPNIEPELIYIEDDDEYEADLLLLLDGISELTEFTSKSEVLAV